MLSVILYPVFLLQYQSHHCLQELDLLEGRVKHHLCAWLVRLVHPLEDRLRVCGPLAFLLRQG